MPRQELDLSGLEESNRIYLNALAQSGQKPLRVTQLFGKDYLWFQDPDSGKLYLERLHYEKSN